MGSLGDYSENLCDRHLAVDREESENTLILALSFSNRSVWNLPPLQDNLALRAASIATFTSLLGRKFGGSDGSRSSKG